ncbi:MAG TPA: potassium channel family protein [Patescibacteria group bacterium]|nr:potassium channel family protein [Patescibacteria group bacterium]
MRVFEATIGAVIVLLVLWDAFEAVVLPRRVTRKFRLARVYYIFAWGIWSGIGRRLTKGKFRDVYLSVFGPLSILGLLFIWALGLVFGFALVQRGAGGATASSGEPVTFLVDLYLSGTTFFTLGLGDVVPRTPPSRVVTVAESGVGFGFLALIIGYLPILYQAFSRREITISLLDARGGSPPSASELLRRFGREENLPALKELMREWERWAAEVLESHLSYPLLVYYRSQHDNQSWLGALTAILDTCAFAIVALEKQRALQTKLTFAMARHAVTDVAQAIRAVPIRELPDRLPPATLERLRSIAEQAGVPNCGAAAWGPEARARLRELRGMYEPYVAGLAERLLVPLPPWVPEGEPHYNWHTTAWQRELEPGTVLVDEKDDHR